MRHSVALSVTQIMPILPVRRSLCSLPRISLPYLKIARESIKTQLELLLGREQNESVNDLSHSNVSPNSPNNNNKHCNANFQKEYIVVESSTFAPCTELFSHTSTQSSAVCELLHTLQPYHELNCRCRHIDYVYKLLEFAYACLKAPMALHVELWMKQMIERSFWGENLESSVTLRYYEISECANKNKSTINARNNNMLLLSVDCKREGYQHEKLLHAVYMPDGHLSYVWLSDKYSMAWNQLCIHELNQMCKRSSWILEISNKINNDNTGRSFYLSRAWEHFDHEAMFVKFKDLESINSNMIRVGLGNSKRFSFPEGRFMLLSWEIFCEIVLRHPVHVTITELLSFFTEHPFSPRVHDITIRFLLLQCKSKVINSVLVLDESQRSERKEQLFILFNTLEQHIRLPGQRSLLAYIKRNLFQHAFTLENKTDKVVHNDEFSPAVAPATLNTDISEHLPSTHERLHECTNINNNAGTSLSDEMLEDVLDDDELFVYLIRKYIYYSPMHAESNRREILKLLHKTAWELLLRLQENEKVYISLYNSTFALWNAPESKRHVAQKKAERKIRGEHGLLDYSILKLSLTKSKKMKENIKFATERCKMKANENNNSINNNNNNNNNSNSNNDKCRANSDVNDKFTHKHETERKTLEQENSSESNCEIENEQQQDEQQEKINQSRVNQHVIQDIIGMGIDAGGYWSTLLKVCDQMCASLMVTDADCTEDNLTNYSSRYDAYWNNKSSNDDNCSSDTNNNMNNRRLAQQHLKYVMCALKRTIISLIMRRSIHVSWIYGTAEMFVRSFPLVEVTSRVLRNSHNVIGLMFESCKLSSSLQRQMWVEANSLAHAMCELETYLTPCYLHCGTVEELLAVEKRRFLLKGVHVDLDTTSAIETVFTGNLLQKLQEMVRSKQKNTADNVLHSRYICMYAIVSQGNCIDVFEKWDDIPVDNLYSKDGYNLGDKLIIDNIEEEISDTTL